MDVTAASTWCLVAAVTACIVVRPFSWPEWIWAVAGALLLVACGLLPLAAAVAGISKGTDVYLFLGGMMLLAELAQQEGLFDWVATRAVRAARGSARRLFALVFAVGVVVTVFLSNDATAVVLTPAVAAVARTADIADPLPFLLVCAFTANAASFVLPISNPANLVIYGNHLPPLFTWLSQFLLPSAVAIVATYATLRWTQRKVLAGSVSTAVEQATLSAGGRAAACGIAATALMLMGASGMGMNLGYPALAAGASTLLAVFLTSGRDAARALGRISWGILPLVGGLFVLVEALERTGLTRRLADLLHGVAERSTDAALWTSGLVLGFGSNLVNNLPAALLAGGVVRQADMAPHVRAAVLVGVDLGPNLSITGSLATLLWLLALRRSGRQFGARAFLRIGAVVMIPALILSLASVSLTS